MEKDVTSPHTSETYRIRQFDLTEHFQQVAVDQTVDFGDHNTLRFFDHWLASGVVTPKVTLGPEVADDEILPEHLGHDRLWLLTEVMYYNGVVPAKSLANFRWGTSMGGIDPQNPLNQKG